MIMTLRRHFRKSHKYHRSIFWRQSIGNWNRQPLTRCRFNHLPCSWERGPCPRTWQDMQLSGTRRNAISGAEEEDVWGQHAGTLAFYRTGFYPLRILLPPLRRKQMPWPFSAADWDGRKFKRCSCLQYCLSFWKITQSIDPSLVHHCTKHALKLCIFICFDFSVPAWKCLKDLFVWKKCLKNQRCEPAVSMLNFAMPLVFPLVSDCNRIHGLVS